MDHCLQIDEIVSVICSNLDGHDYDSQIRYPTRIRSRKGSSLRALAALARTCRALQEPALDVLWREIPDLFILVKHLMPAELLRFDDASRTVFFTRLPSDAEWKRLDPYVPRIRAVGIPVPSGTIRRVLDAGSVLQPLESYLMRRAIDGDVLFPDLTHVVYQPYWTDPLYSRLLLHPRVRVLQLPTVAFTDFDDWASVLTFRAFSILSSRSGSGN
ncbi:hypothetical protein OH77DRAFT_1519843 [Trametes cingulata]|nr:hypothetical protein OH77DRAFT_1519843 [Trametes cingulata]